MCLHWSTLALLGAGRTRWMCVCVWLAPWRGLVVTKVHGKGLCVVWEAPERATEKASPRTHELILYTRFRLHVRAVAPD